MPEVTLYLGVNAECEHTGVMKHPGKLASPRTSVVVHTPRAGTRPRLPLITPEAARSLIQLSSWVSLPVCIPFALQPSPITGPIAGSRIFGNLGSGYLQVCSEHPLEVP